MPDDSYERDAEIIRAAYAEKVMEAFKALAENLGTGQNQANSTERFVRSLHLLRKARDLAIGAAGGVTANGVSIGEKGTSNERKPAEAALGDMADPGTDALSPEDQALVDQALAGTTGARPLPRRR